MPHRRLYIFAAITTLAAFGIAALVSVHASKPVPPPVAPAAPLDPAYATTVQPIFERRCVVCHSCFDAPCQLNLQSFEGLDRGANVGRVYDPSRLESIHPTRMFQDARTTAEWQQRFGFFPVVARQGTETERRENSLLFRVVDQRRRVPVRTRVSIDAAMTCPRDVAALDDELLLRPERGMPLGFPPLGDDDARAVTTWVQHGAGKPPLVQEAEPVRAAIARWEAFFNAADPKSRLVARYLYEHLFLAHLALEGVDGEWFRLVRSRTQAPAAIDELVTVRPYDDPGVSEFHYRLERLNETIVEKTHVPYLLSDQKLALLHRIFFDDTEWADEAPPFPSYQPNVAANPFVAFAAIPARARYRFMLEDAYYHVRAFIHGPVCKGQVALNVIDEHFLIFFLTPERDPALSEPDFLASVAGALAVPAQGRDGLDAVYERFRLQELAYLQKRAALLQRQRPAGRALSDFWYGDGTKPGPVLTVYRHFDSAFVVAGAVGGLPKTAWVLDYPIFERMYYDLVAGFDVFGNLVHQISTRRYMNLLRIEAESQFLSFLPKAQRRPTRDFWYRPPEVAKVIDLLDLQYGEPETRISYTDRPHAKDELVTRLLSQALPLAVLGEHDPIQGDDVPTQDQGPAAVFEHAVRPLVRRMAPFVAAFPDATLLRVNTGSPADTIYTVIRNKAHLNIDFMFLENEERAPAEDTLHIVRGVVVSRPNLFLDVPAAAVKDFAADVTALPNELTWAKFLDRYGVRRNAATFWATSDFFNARFATLTPLYAGILDLSRYVND